MRHTSGYQPTSGATPGTPPPEPAGDSNARTSHHRLAIRAVPPGERSTVTLDGHDIAHALTGLTLTVGVGQVPTATLDLLLLDVTEVQDSETRILIPDATRAALIALGWTPPADPHATAEPTDDLDITDYLVVHRYRTDQGHWTWCYRCWGDDTCDGHLALDLSNRPYAERKARQHLAERHTVAKPAKEDGPNPQ